VIESVPTGRAEVVSVAVVTAVEPDPLVVSVAVPSVTPPLANVTVPVGEADAPAVVGTVKVSTTGEPKVELVGFAVSVSPVLATGATVSLTEEEIVLKLPDAGAVAVIVSVPTGSPVVVMVAAQVAGLPEGVPGKAAVPKVIPPLAKVTVEVGQAPLMAATVSVSATGAP
jgi:hypothetical protein